MNSFKAVKVALEFEISRHRQLKSSGGRIVQETRLWDEDKAMTFTMRSKEEAHDYRYFPEPDLVPFTVNDATIDSVRKSIGESPFEKLERLMEDYNISKYEASILIQDPTQLGQQPTLPMLQQPPEPVGVARQGLCSAQCCTSVGL